MTENAHELEPTDDDVADGTQLPMSDDMPDEEGDAGVEGVPLDADVIDGEY